MSFVIMKVYNINFAVNEELKNLKRCLISRLFS